MFVYVCVSVDVVYGFTGIIVRGLVCECVYCVRLCKSVFCEHFSEFHSDKNNLIKFWERRA